MFNKGKLADISKIKKIVDKIFKHELRMKIFLLLRLYDKLNVTEVSKLLNRNKATVGRHLKIMRKHNILVSKEKEAKGKFNPLYYSISDTFYEVLALANGSKFPKKSNVEQSRGYYKISLEVIRGIYKLVKHAISLINPFMEYLNKELEKANPDFKELEKYLTLHNQLGLRHFVISEDNLNNFWEIYLRFYEDLEKLESQTNSTNTKKLLFIDALLPLKDMLEQSGDK
ncbi:MAG: ArsR family transcriptional regulator [Promethearchaeia archaeon]